MELRKCGKKETLVRAAARLGLLSVMQKIYGSCVSFTAAVVTDML